MVFVVVGCSSSSNSDNSVPPPEVITPPPVSISSEYYYDNDYVFVEEGTMLDTEQPFIDDGGDANFYLDFSSPASIPMGITINSSTGVISVAADVDVGIYNISVLVTNSAGEADFDDVLTIEVNQAGLEVAYVSNQGVLLHDKMDGSKVLIDALFRPFYAQFDAPSGDLQSQLENAESTYSEVKLVLATHEHEDHFSSQAVGSHLSSNLTGQFLASNQVMERLKEEYSDYSFFESRMLEVTPEVHEITELMVNDILIQMLVIGTTHVGNFSTTENMAYLVNLGSKKILHIGDARLTEDNFAELGLADLNIDVLIVPHWDVLTTEGQSVINDIIKPKHLIVNHLPLNTSIVSDIKSAFRNETVLLDEGDSLKLP